MAVQGIESRCPVSRPTALTLRQPCLCLNPAKLQASGLSRVREFHRLMLTSFISVGFNPLCCLCLLLLLLIVPELGAGGSVTECLWNLTLPFFPPHAWAVSYRELVHS